MCFVTEMTERWLTNEKWNVLKCLVEADVWERIGGVQTNVAHWTFDVIFRLEPVKNVFEDTLKWRRWFRVIFWAGILTDLQKACIHSITIDASIKYPVQRGQVKKRLSSCDFRRVIVVQPSVWQTKCVIIILSFDFTVERKGSLFLKGDDGIIWLSRQGHRSLRGRPFFSYSAISRRQSAPTWVAMPFWTEYLLAAYLGAFLMMSSDFLSKWEMRKWENWQDQLTPLTRAAVLFNLPRAVA